MELLLTILGISIPALILSWYLPEKWQLFPLVVTTAIFIICVSPISFAILSISGTSTFYALKYLSSKPTSTILVVIQLCLIFLFFKLEFNFYFNMAESAVIPIGLSYYSFRQIHYAVESYKNQLPRHTFTDYINYLFFLPTILIGPINRFQPFLKDFNKRRWNDVLFSKGLERILYGFVKIVVIGNFLISHKMSGLIANLPADFIWLSTYLKVFKFAANAYIQFAGYSDVAIGLSLMFGFKITENFKAPFLATNIADFWKRWHLSLSDWCKDYVFFPFLSITRNALISIIMTMLTIGIWHEISFRYILWGLIHAIAINVWYRYEKSTIHKKLKKFSTIQKGLGIFITLHFVIFSFIIVSEPNLKGSFDIFKILFFIK